MSGSRTISIGEYRVGYDDEEPGRQILLVLRENDDGSTTVIGEVRGASASAVWSVLQRAFPAPPPSIPPTPEETER